MNPVKYSIKDLERITGIKAHTIRMWEKRYGIIMPERTSTNIRYYTDQNLQKLLNISILNKNGFKISRIAELTEDEIIKEVELISDSKNGLDANINSLIMAAVDMQEDIIEKTLNSSILSIGFENTFCNLVFPLFQKIDVFWQIGRMNSCQQRFISNLVRQKLLVAIDGLVGQTNPEPRCFLMFMPSGEFNEIGLLFANYLVRKSGQEVVYLGPSVPLEHLKRLADDPKFTDILLNFTHPQFENSQESYFKNLSRIFPTQNIHVIFSGDLGTRHIDIGSKLHIFNTFSDFSDYTSDF